MKVYQKFGILTGIISGIWSMISFGLISWLNENVFHLEIAARNVRSVSGILSLIILLAGIFKGMQSDNRIKTGIGISLITACILSLFTFIYCTFINPGYTDFMVNQARLSLAASGKSSSEILSGLHAARREFSTGAQVAMAFIGQLVTGTIASCIFYYILRNSKKRSEN